MSRSATQLGDGLSVLRDELALCEVMRLIERTARWVDPETFRLLPVWYPEHARRADFYKGGWTERQMNRNRQTGQSEYKREGNVYANKSLTYALGLRSGGRQNWSCCHIWGVDDASHQKANTIVQDHRFYSCVANMVLLPTPLKAFTDTWPEVKAMLRICARHLYGWHCDHERLADTIAEIDTWGDWEAYPKSWPRSGVPSTPLGVVRLNQDIQQSAARRWGQIQSDLAKPGTHYPRETVEKVLAYWKEALNGASPLIV